MIRKLLIFILSGILFCANVVNAEEIVKINNVNFDNSDSVIFIGTSAGASSSLEIQKGKLSNPDRIFLDIKNAVYTQNKSNFILKNSLIKEFKIGQFSTNPNIVRIVIYYDPSFKPEDLKVLKHNNNIFLKINNETPKQDYMTSIYDELKDSNSKVDATLSINADSINKMQETQTAVKLPIEPPEDDIFNEINKAFNETTSQIYLETNAAKVGANFTPSQSVRGNNEPFKEYKLRSKYYVDKINIKNGNILISGVGIVNVKRFIYLANPNRIVIDLPDTIVAQNIRNSELKISETEKVKIGQFEPTTARIVITTDSYEKYRPIYSFDLQGLLIANDERMDNIKLSNNSADITRIKVIPLNSITDNVLINFSDKIVHSIKRDSNKLELNLYNASAFDVIAFKNAFKSTSLETSRMEKLPYQGIKITIPIKPSSTVDCYENINATQLKITIKTPKPIEHKSKAQPQAIVPANISGMIVILDPGHGGADTGALRAGQAEKDITLDIAKKTASILINKGIHVEMTRWNDSTVTLQDRVEFANLKNPAVYVSIHINSSVKPEINGIETHYYRESGYEVAKVLHKSIMANIDSVNRGLFKSKFYVINHTEAPSVLLELGFLSNDKERNELLTEERKNKSAQAIADGIINYLKTQPKR